MVDVICSKNLGVEVSSLYFELSLPVYKQNYRIFHVLNDTTLPDKGPVSLAIWSYKLFIRPSVYFDDSFVLLWRILMAFFLGTESTCKIENVCFIVYVSLILLKVLMV